MAAFFIEFGSNNCNKIIKSTYFKQRENYSNGFIRV